MLTGGGLLLILIVALTTWAIVESFMADPDRVRGLPKAIWVIIVLLFLPFGALAWFIFGRPRRPALSRTRATRAGNWNDSPTAAPRRAGPIAPDDDPEFLLRLRDQLRKKPDDDHPA